ncbi:MULTISPECIES: AzlD family protein [Rhizobium]|uniref:AzlD family protein n=1 Tax=Rhizobium TaxID=379 RepID=UPI0007EA9C19|nr:MULTISPECIES: AzlD domain-containing protein [Rhizobium]ANK90993.1 branched-chain amino acid transporter AzlD family protein [Rhizobium sp. N6212]ANK97022.1 branched-chain amino acid transporter AzlD family protein [Rhizobium sp. N621]ANL03142.1 branched-chain amino acid transporter AzlD family protein [Rhizobium esperanzae]ANL09191.1 branched-chain amino acid transporter AzlD family protein [Rhizobium sp. N1341]ANL21237.1 branched-chain amino acid transporter AzlD family protein [Rhizobium
MTLDSDIFFAILAMAAATVFTRVSGLVLIRHVEIDERRRTAIDAIPPAVLMAVIAPTAFATGWAETLACAATAIAARRLPMLASVVVGVATVALLRAAGL